MSAHEHERTHHPGPHSVKTHPMAALARGLGGGIRTLVTIETPARECRLEGRWYRTGSIATAQRQAAYGGSPFAWPLAASGTRGSSRLRRNPESDSKPRG